MARNRTKRQSDTMAQLAALDLQHDENVAEVQNLLEGYGTDAYDPALPHRLFKVHGAFDQHSDIPDAIEKLASHGRTLAQNFVASPRGNLQGADGNCELVLGNAGAGKTYLVRRTLERSPKTNQMIEGKPKQLWIFATLSEEAKRKSIAEDILMALGMVLSPGHGFSVADLWNLVRSTLLQRNIAIVVLDESQHAVTTETRAREILDAMKFLLNNSYWRVNLICVGLPRLLDMFDSVSSDLAAQFWRRSSPLLMKKLATRKDRAMLVTLTARYAELANLQCADDLQLEDAHGAMTNGLLAIGKGGAGEIIPMIHKAVLIAADKQANEPAYDVLSLIDFERAYRKMENCADKHNPFSSDYGGQTAPLQQTIADLRSRCEDGRK